MSRLHCFTHRFTPRFTLAKRLASATAITVLLGTYSAGAAAAAQAQIQTQTQTQSPTGPCPTNAARIACVDLSRQVMWVQSHGRVTWGPVHIRSGSRATPTHTGLWHIYRRAQQHYSTINGVWMPYSQFFNRGAAFHGTRTPLAARGGSLGCVTMTPSDASALWRVTKVSDPVYIFGRKPVR